MHVLFCLFLLFLDAGREAGVLIFLDPYLTLNRLIQRYLSLGLLYIRYLLDCIQQHLHEVVVIKAVYLDKKIVRDEVTNNGTLRAPYLRLIVFILRYVAPIAIGFILINQLGLVKLF